MKPKHRQAQISELVSKTGEASVDALASRFSVSAETIRRDLGRLAKDGVIQKVHGGARRSPLLAEGSFLERMAENAAAKAEIARKLVPLIAPGDTLFIDTGSTTLACAQELASVPGLTVITNSVRVARTLSGGSGEARVFLLGGEYRADNAQTIGPSAIEQIQGYQADHALITVAAFDTSVGAMDADLEEAQVARAMIQCSRRLVVVADATKFGRKAAFRVSRLDDIDILITDRAPSPALAAALEKSHVELH